MSDSRRRKRYTSVKKFEREHARRKARDDVRREQLEQRFTPLVTLGQPMRRA